MFLMHIINSWKFWQPMFWLSSFILPSVSDPVVKPLSEFNTKYFGGIDCFSIRANPCIVIIESLAEVQLDSIRHLLKLKIILRVNKHLWENFVCQCYLMTYNVYGNDIFDSGSTMTHIHHKNVSKL